MPQTFRSPMRVLCNKELSIETRAFGGNRRPIWSIGVHGCCKVATERHVVFSLPPTIGGCLGHFPERCRAHITLLFRCAHDVISARGYEKYGGLSLLDELAKAPPCDRGNNLHHSHSNPNPIPKIETPHGCAEGTAERGSVFVIPRTDIY